MTRLEQLLRARTTQEKGKAAGQRYARQVHRHTVLGILLSGVMAAVTACTVHNVADATSPVPMPGSTVPMLPQQPLWTDWEQGFVALGGDPGCLTPHVPVAGECTDGGVFPMCPDQRGFPGSGVPCWWREGGEVWYVPGGAR